MLTKQLRELEQDGIIQRTVYAEVPPRVEYNLTEFGKTLKPILDELEKWGKRHLEQLEKNRGEA
jgi:DNA-binding HxlR family transcriptional regulator